MFDNKMYRNMSLNKLNKELLKAVSINNLPLIEYLLTSPELSYHANIHYRGEGLNSLMIACSQGYLEVIDYLLTSPNLKEIAHIYPTEKLYSNDLIRFNCFSGNIEAVKYLLTHPKLKEYFNIFEEDALNKNSLLYAATHGYLNIFELLLKLTDSNIIKENLTQEHCQKILINACANGHINIVDYLLTSSYFKEHIDIYKCNDMGMNILMFSSSHLHPNLTKHLLNSEHINLDINSQDYLGRNLLDIAILNKQLSLSEILIIDKNIKFSEHTKYILSNNKNKDFSSLLDKVRIRDEYENLHKSINYDKIDNSQKRKKVKV